MGDGGECGVKVKAMLVVGVVCDWFYLRCATNTRDY